MKQKLLGIVNTFPEPRRLSWVIKALNAQEIVPNENEIKSLLSQLEKEGKITISKSILGNNEYGKV